MIDARHGWNASIKPIIIGFIISAVALFAAYRMVVHSHVSGATLVSSLLVIATFQGLCQLIFFIHLGLESKPRWNVMMFLMTVFVMVILIWGSAWIMGHLKYNESIKTSAAMHQGAHYVRYTP